MTTLLLGLSIVSLLSTAEAQSWTEIAPGVQYAQWTNGDPNRISALQVNLCRSGVRVRATASEDRGQTTSSWGSSEGLVAAVNGGFFTSGYAPDQGRAAGFGAEWYDSTDSTARGFLAFGEHQMEHSLSGTTASLGSWVEEAVNGDATLVYDGAVIDCGGCGSGRNPRTAAGWSSDQGTLFLVAVDGRSSSSAGMTIDELAILMGGLGVWRAMNLDGGGSTTMWTSASGVVNDPSDGSERTVANHLGIDAPGSGLQHNCPRGYGATWAGMDFPGAVGTTIYAPAGSEVSGSAYVVNSGTYAWDTTNTKLAPLPRDAASSAAASDWLDVHRIATPAAAVQPGETGTFDFSLTMPPTEGETLVLQFTLLQEAVSWFGDSWGPVDGHWYLTLVATAPIVDTGGPAPEPADTDPGWGDTGIDGGEPDPGWGDEDPATVGDRFGEAVPFTELGCGLGCTSAWQRGAGGGPPLGGLVLAGAALASICGRRRSATRGGAPLQGPHRAAEALDARSPGSPRRASLGAGHRRARR